MGSLLAVLRGSEGFSISRISLLLIPIYVQPPSGAFAIVKPAERSAMSSRAAETAGFAAFTIALEACARPAAVSVPESPAFMPTNAAAIVPAAAMASIFKWVARSAASRVCVIFDLVCASESHPKDELVTGFPTGRFRVSRLHPSAMSQQCSDTAYAPMDPAFASRAHSPGERRVI